MVQILSVLVKPMMNGTGIVCFGETDGKADMRMVIPEAMLPKLINWYHEVNGHTQVKQDCFR